MTTISEIALRKIDDPRSVKSERTPIATAVLPVVVACILTALNSIAAIYVYRSIKNLAEIETRLGELKAFEDRIAGQVDIMNTGIQGRLETLQTVIDGQIGGLHNEMTRLAVPPQNEENAFVDNVPVFSEASPEQEAEIAANVDPVPQMEVPKPAANNTARAKLAGKPASYERVQSPDGKVYYRKVR